MSKKKPSPPKPAPKRGKGPTTPDQGKGTLVNDQGRARGKAPGDDSTDSTGPRKTPDETE